MLLKVKGQITHLTANAVQHVTGEAQVKIARQQ